MRLKIAKGRHKKKEKKVEREDRGCENVRLPTSSDDGKTGADRTDNAEHKAATSATRKNGRATGFMTDPFLVPQSHHDRPKSAQQLG